MTNFRLNGFPTKYGLLLADAKEETVRPVCAYLNAGGDGLCRAPRKIRSSPSL